MSTQGSVMNMSGKEQHVDLNHPAFLQSIKRREQASWAQLYEHMQVELYAFLRDKLPSCDETDIEDCVPEVFSRAYADIEAFQGHSGLQTWLMRVASLIARETLRAVPQ